MDWWLWRPCRRCGRSDVGDGAPPCLTNGGRCIAPSLTFVDANEGLYAYRAYRSSVFRDEFRMDRYGQLYHSEQIISGTEDTNSNFARDISKEISRLGPGHIVKLADGSMGLRGFLVFNTMGGGMGFRHGALFLERLSVDFDGSTTTAKIWDEG
ncbi:hypothetical protein PR001_g24854 [Phytophthora rubi]|uniref:Uncharacterized protein n=1 Tax=Phytophthora rubi TaxID=129364 RepID=A0A6A3IDD8_9STRA|nr:hypothetical protein PR001_g24854 [Phytophthora rubi]